MLLQLLQVSLLASQAKIFELLNSIISLMPLRLLQAWNPVRSTLKTLLPSRLQSSRSALQCSSILVHQQNPGHSPAFPNALMTCHSRLWIFHVWQASMQRNRRQTHRFAVPMHLTAVSLPLSMSCLCMVQKVLLLCRLLYVLPSVTSCTRQPRLAHGSSSARSHVGPVCAASQAVPSRPASFAAASHRSEPTALRTKPSQAHLAGTSASASTNTSPATGQVAAQHQDARRHQTDQALVQLRTRFARGQQQQRFIIQAWSHQVGLSMQQLKRADSFRGTKAQLLLEAASGSSR